MFLNSQKRSYDGTFSNDVISGTGKMTYETGDIYVGRFKENKKHGPGEYTRSNGYIMKGNWDNDIKNGHFE